MKIGTVHKASISYTRTMDGFTNQTLHKNFGRIHKPNPAQELWTNSHTKSYTRTLDRFTFSKKKYFDVKKNKYMNKFNAKIVKI